MNAQITRSWLLVVALAAVATMRCSEQRPVSDPCPCEAGWICDKSGGEPGICVPSPTKKDSGLNGDGSGSQYTETGLPIYDSTHPGKDIEYKDLFTLVDASLRDLPIHTGTWKPLGKEIAKQLGLGATPFGATAVWGSSSKDVYLLGPQGGIVHFNGTSWKLVHQHKGLTALWGNSPKNIFAVGNAEGSLYQRQAIVLHFNGVTWKKLNSNIGANLTAVWGSSATDVYAVGQMEGNLKCAITHYDGKNWKEVQPSTCSVGLKAVWGGSAKNVYVAGGNNAAKGLSVVLRYDGTSWKYVGKFAIAAINGLWGFGTSTVYAVGYGKTVLRYNGTKWLLTTPVGKGHYISGVWGSGSADIYAVGDVGVWHFNGKNWGIIPGVKIQNPLSAVWGSSKSDVWVVGPDAVWHLH